jgi:hypothetical protein
MRTEFREWHLRNAPVWMDHLMFTFGTFGCCILRRNALVEKEKAKRILEHKYIFFQSPTYDENV